MSASTISTAPVAHQVKMILGIPRLEERVLLAKARELGAPILISANGFSRWRMERGLREWAGFKISGLTLAQGMEVWLDSAGFTGMKKYNGFPWMIHAYVALAARYPFFRWASMDYCVEEKVAANREEVLDRLSRTISANYECRSLARDYGIEHSFMPVIQGRTPEDYLRCIERMPMVFDYSIVGVGSMCRRNRDGKDGILAVVAALDRAFAGTDVQLHLFGLKSQGAEAVRAHPRVYSVDSQAYGSAARWDAVKAGHSKSNEFVAGVMADWFLTQQDRLGKPGFSFQGTLDVGVTTTAPAADRYQCAANHAREEYRLQIEERQLDHDQIIERYVEATMGEILSNGKGALVRAAKWRLSQRVKKMPRCRREEALVPTVLVGLNPQRLAYPNRCSCCGYRYR